MSCAYDKERLSAFFDGELDAAERAETERHISGCSECLRDLGEIKSAALAVKSLPRPRAPRSVADGVSREIAGAGRLRRLDVWRRRLLIGVSAAAALLVVLNLSYFTGRSAETPTAAKTPAAAPVLAVTDAKTRAAEGKDGQERLFKAETNALQADEKAGANRQSAAQDKAVEESRRGLDREKKAADLAEKPQEAPVVARKSADAAAAKPPAPPGAAPAPKPEPEAPRKPAAAPPAPSAPMPDAELAKKLDAAKLKESKDDALRGRLEQGEQRGRVLSTSFAYTVGAAKAVDARAQVESLAQKWAAATKAAPTAKAAAEAAPATAAPRPTVSGGGAGFGRAVEPLVVEVTPAQLEELREALAKAGATFQEGAPEALKRAGEREGFADGKKEVEAEKDRRADAGAARKVTLYFVEAKK